MQTNYIIPISISIPILSYVFYKYRKFMSTSICKTCTKTCCHMCKEKCSNNCKLELLNDTIFNIFIYPSTTNDAEWTQPSIINNITNSILIVDEIQKFYDDKEKYDESSREEKERELGAREKVKFVRLECKHVQSRNAYFRCVINYLVQPHVSTNFKLILLSGTPFTTKPEIQLEEIQHLLGIKDKIKLPNDFADEN